MSFSRRSKEQIRRAFGPGRVRLELARGRKERDVITSVFEHLLLFYFACAFLFDACLYASFFVTNYLEKLSKIHQQMMPRSVPKAISERGQQKGGHIKRKTSPFLLIMLIFGNFWAPPQKPRGRQKRPKKFNTPTFGHPGAAKR